MIDSVTGSAAAVSMRLQAGNNTPSLSQEQRQTINEVLSRFDSGNLTRADAASIVEAFQESGIQPGRELTEAMAEAGFDAREVGELAGVEGPRQGGGPMMPKGPPPKLDISEEMLQELNDLLNEYYSDGASEDERETTLSAIKDIFRQTVPEGGLVDEMA